MLPRGGIVSSPRATTATSAERGRPSSRTAAPAIEWSGPTSKSISSSEPSGSTCERRHGRPRCERDHPEPLGHPFERRPLDQGRDGDDEEDGVEDRLAALQPGRQRERAEHDRHGAAQARPAEQRALAVGEAAERGRRPDGDRPDHDHRAAPRAQGPTARPTRGGSGRRAGRARRTSPPAPGRRALRGRRRAAGGSATACFRLPGRPGTRPGTRCRRRRRRSRTRAPPRRPRRPARARRPPAAAARTTTPPPRRARRRSRARCSAGGGRAAPGRRSRSSSSGSSEIRPIVSATPSGRCRRSRPRACARAGGECA